MRKQMRWTACFLMMPGLAWGQEACQGLPATNSELVQDFEAATTAFSSFSIDAFTAAAQSAAEHVVCLSEPISRPNAAEFHRVRGLLFFIESDVDAARVSFAAARLIEPAYSFPTDLVVPGSPVLEQYTAIDPMSSPTRDLERPAVGSLRLNGSRSLNHRTSLPTVFQQLDGRGRVVLNALLEPGVDVPAYAVVEPDVVPPPARVKNGPNKALLYSGVAAGVVAAGLYTGALASSSNLSGARSVSAIQARSRRANRLTLASAGVGVAALGLGTTSFFVQGSF